MASMYTISTSAENSISAMHVHSNRDRGNLALVHLPVGPPELRVSNSDPKGSVSR
jgi:hypothetical protein|eukprot:COSAG02_NODE_11053_length_1804_cov_2.583578_1_plen_55_part_00